MLGYFHKLDDEFVQDVSDCETVDAYKEQVKGNLTKKKVADFVVENAVEK